MVLRSLLIAFGCGVGLALAVACGTDASRLAMDAGLPDGAGDAGADSADEVRLDAESGAARSYRLASGGVQLLVQGPAIGFQMTQANLAEDVDVVDLHQEYYGVPWDAFLANTDPPAAWAATIDALAAAAKGMARPIFLSVSMLNGSRSTVAARTLIQSTDVKSEDHWAAECFDFATATNGAALGQAYLRYVGWMIDHTSPRWLNVAVEVNLFLEKCPSAANGVVQLANAAYDLAKSKDATIVVFPSIQIDHLYGYDTGSCPDPNARAACFDAGYAAIAPLKRDRFAISTYPQGPFTTPLDIPDDWLTRGASRAKERPIIAETGWNSTAIIAQQADGSCTSVRPSTEADEAAYLDRVLFLASNAGVDLVDLWDDRDLVIESLMTNCPCAFDPTWCTVLDVFRGPKTDSGVDTQFFGELELKAFGTMGLRAYDGTPKAAVMARWRAARALTIAP